MKSSHVWELALATSVIAFGLGLTDVPAASAEPNDSVQADAPAPPPGGAGLTAPPPRGSSTPVSADNANPEAVTACSQFATALDVAATYYSDFADAIAGQDGSYADAYVTSANATGRTALRQAAATALDASATPGLQPEIAAPMQAWSWDATKLLLLMGIHSPVDAINAKATDLNTDTHNAQMACATAGTHA